MCDCDYPEDFQVYYRGQKYNHLYELITDQYERGYSQGRLDELAYGKRSVTETLNKIISYCEHEDIKDVDQSFSMFKLIKEVATQELNR